MFRQSIRVDSDDFDTSPGRLRMVRPDLLSHILDLSSPLQQRETACPASSTFSKELVGRRALVTGGTRGIGAAIAQRLLDAGAKVVVTARSRGEALPAGAVFVAGDVTSVSGVKAVAAGALEALGGLDILVNNAGGASGFPQGEQRPSQTRSGRPAFALNLFAAIRLTNALLPSLRESKVGRPS